MRPMPGSSPPARFKRAVREHPLAAFLLTAPLAWRVTTFRVLAALGGCVFLVPLQQAISPWGAVTLSNTDGVTDVNLHRWSAALAGGPDAGLAALLFYLAWRPMRAQLVLQWAALAAIVFLAANVPFAGPAVAVYAIPVVLVLAAYPEPRALLKAPWVDGLRLPLLGPGILIAVFLLVDASRAMVLQIGGTGELARNYEDRVGRTRSPEEERQTVASVAWTTVAAPRAGIARGPIVRSVTRLVLAARLWFGGPVLGGVFRTCRRLAGLAVAAGSLWRRGLPRGGRMLVAWRLALLARRRTDAVADSTLAGGTCGLALAHDRLDLLAPGRRIGASGHRGRGDCAARECGEAGRGETEHDPAAQRLEQARQAARRRISGRRRRGGCEEGTELLLERPAEPALEFRLRHRGFP